MAFTLSSTPTPPPHLLPRKTSRAGPSFLCHSSTPSGMDQQMRGSKLMEFPHLLDPHRDTMVSLISAVENRLGSHLLPSSVPPDVEYYQNETGTSQGTLSVRCGIDSSPVRLYSLLYSLSLFLSARYMRTHGASPCFLGHNLQNDSQWLG